MSTIRRRHFSRILLWQECVGNVLDLPPRYCLAGAGPDVQENTSATGAGTERPTERTHTIEVPLSEEETARLARIMEELSTVYGHRVGATLLGSQGAQHIQWAEPTSLRVLPEGRDFFGMAASVLRLKTSVFHASIGETTNLIEPVPWEGASTPGSVGQADGVTTLGGGELVVYDKNLGEVFLYEAWDGPTYRRFAEPTGLDGGITSFVRSGEEELIAIHSGDASVSRIDPSDGTQLDTFEPRTPGGGAYNHQGITVANGDLVVLGANDDLYQYSGVPSSGAVNASSETSISSESGVALTFDAESGDLLSIQDDAGTLKLRRHDGVSGTITDTATLSTAGISAYGGRLYALSSPEIDNYGDLGASGIPTSTADSATLSRRMPLRVRGNDGRPERGYYGPTWKAAHEVSVDVLGIPDTVSSSNPIELEFVYPAGGSEVRLQGVTGELDGVSFSGTALTISDSSRIGSPPQILLEGGKYSGLDINASTVWALKAIVEDVADRPELVVVQQGDPRGPLRGAYSDTCVSSPAWAGSAVNPIAFDVDASAGDELSISVTEATGTDNYVGQISGDGDSVKGNSATFTYEKAGTYTAEMVAQPDFEGVTELTLDTTQSSPQVGLSNADFSKLDDLTKASFISFSLSGGLTLPTSNRYSQLEFADFSGAISLSSLPPADDYRLFAPTFTDSLQNFLTRTDPLTFFANKADFDAEIITSVPSSITGRLDLPDPGLPHDVKVDAQAFPGGSPVEFIRCVLGDGNGTKATRNPDNILSDTDPSQLRFKNGAGEASLESGIQVYVGQFQGLDLYPSQTQISNSASSLSVLRIVLDSIESVDGGPVPERLPHVEPAPTGSNNGRDATGFVDSLWQERANLSGINTRLREGEDTYSSLTQKALNQIIGHPSDDSSPYWKDGLVDGGNWQVNENRNLAVQDMVGQSVLQSVDTSANEAVFDLSNQVRVESGGITAQDFADAAFALGNHFRLLNTGSVDGVYRVASKSLSNEVLTVTIDTSTSGIDTAFGADETDFSGANCYAQWGDNPNR